MKCQILFSEKNKKNIINLSSAENAQRVVKVKINKITLKFTNCTLVPDAGLVVGHFNCPPPFRRKVEGHCFWFSVGRGAWRVARGAWCVVPSF